MKKALSFRFAGKMPALRFGFVLLLAVASGIAQTAAPKSTPQSSQTAPAKSATATPQAPGQPAAALESVLSQMDAAASQFKSAQAEFVWEQYQKVVNETDSQKGTIYFRRAGKQSVEMSAAITEPDKKYVLFSDAKLQLYQPKIDQLTLYDTGKNKAEFESFLVLGFGGRGHDLPKSFDVTLGGFDNLAGVRTARLELAPKGEKARTIFNHITLWIDTTRGVSVQQRFQEPSGDYRLAKYSNIHINQELPRDAFKLKTTSKTTKVTPQS
jgi:outer membrane lipoprotein-sorting protein